jgi:biopolymer transport protein ExbD
MRRARRTGEHTRIDITPLLDVVFLLLTFLVFSLALSARYRVTELTLPATSVGNEAEPGPAVLVELAPDGVVSIDGEAVADGGLEAALNELGGREPRVALFVAADEAAPAGALLKLVDDLREAGFPDLRVLRDRPVGER